MTRYVTATITAGPTEWARRLVIGRQTWERELASAPRVMVETGDDVLNCSVTAGPTEVAITILPGTTSLGPCRIRLPRTDAEPARLLALEPTIERNAR